MVVVWLIEMVVVVTGESGGGGDLINRCEWSHSCHGGV